MRIEFFKIHVYEFISQNQKFSQLNREVQPVKEHVLRKQKKISNRSEPPFFLQSLQNGTKIRFRVSCGPSIFAKGAQPFCLSFFHPNDLKL